MLTLIGALVVGRLIEGDDRLLVHLRPAKGCQTAHLGEIALDGRQLLKYYNECSNEGVGVAHGAVTCTGAEVGALLSVVAKTNLLALPGY